MSLTLTCTHALAYTREPRGFTRQSLQLFTLMSLATFFPVVLFSPRLRLFFHLRFSLITFGVTWAGHECRHCYPLDINYLSLISHIFPDARPLWKTCHGDLLLLVDLFRTFFSPLEMTRCDHQIDNRYFHPETFSRYEWFSFTTLNLTLVKVHIVNPRSGRT